MSLWEKGPGPEGKEQGQRAGWLGLGGAEMLRICPVSTFFVWGGRRCQGTELSENVQHRLLSKAGLPWGHSPHSSRFSDLLGGKKAQEAQRAQKIKSYMAVSAASQPSPMLASSRALLQVPVCSDSQRSQKTQGDKASLGKGKGPGEPSSEPPPEASKLQEAPKGTFGAPRASKEL